MFSSTSHLTKATPILLLAQGTEVAKPVSELLRPEHDIIHQLQSASYAKSMLPRIISGHSTSATLEEDTVGSLDFSRAPRVILVGGGFELEEVEEIRNAVASSASAGSGSGTAIPWLVRGADFVTRTGPPGPEFPKNAAAAIKAGLKRLEDEGLLGSEGLYFW